MALSALDPPPTMSSDKTAQGTVSSSSSIDEKGAEDVEKAVAQAKAQVLAYEKPPWYVGRMS